MGNKYKKLTIITMLIISILLIIIQNIESNLVFITEVLSKIYLTSEDAFKIVIESTKDPLATYIPNYIRQLSLLVITLISIPLCLKYKYSIVSKISIILIMILSLLDIVYLSLNDFLNYTFLYGYVSMFIFIYSSICSIFIFKKNNK